MRIKAVLFDLDGTLLDRDTSLAEFVRDQFDRLFAGTPMEKEKFVRRFIELDAHGYVWKDKVYQQLIAEYAIEGWTWEQLLDDYLHRFQKHCVGYPHMKEMLLQLKSKGLKLALVSNGFGQFQYDNFKALNISHLFDEVLISEWEGLRKPDPAIFIRALSKLGVQADEAVFVGDHPHNDVHASRSAGMRAVWKRNGDSGELVDADGVIDDLAELISFLFPTSI